MSPSTTEKMHFKILIVSHSMIFKHMNLPLLFFDIGQTSGNVLYKALLGTTVKPQCKKLHDENKTFYCELYFTFKTMPCIYSPHVHKQLYHISKENTDSVINA